jgi:Family of unknown function (DUF6159)
MFGRLSRGWSMAKASFQVLKQHPRLMIFPLISGATFLAIIGVIIASAVWNFGFSVAGLDRFADKANSFWLYAAAFPVLVLLTTIALFFNVALIHCALRAHAGETPTVRAGFTAAMGLLPQILGWALFATTIGIVLNFIHDTLKNYLGFLGSLLGGLLEFSWAVVTYFVVPVLVTERVGPITAVKRSATILRAKWGESLAGEARIGLLSGLAFVLAALVFFIGLAIALIKGPAAVAGLGVILMVLGVVAGVAIMVVAQTLSTIFLSGVYIYATTDQVPPSLDRAMVEGAFKPKA